MEHEIYEENNPVNFNPLQKKQYSKKSKASMCRELLKQIRSLTFLIQDNNVFDKLEEDLRDILEDLKLNAPTENGLVKETLSSVRSSPKKGIFRDCLPKPRQKKSSLAGRAGIGTEKRRYIQTIEVSEDENSKKAKLVEEWAPEDGSAYNICMQNTWNPNCFYEENIALKEKVETSSVKEENRL